MHHSFSSRCTQRGGFALILVLIAISFITVVVVFFLTNVGRERRGIDQYARGSDARNIAGTAVNLVMGQINAATKEGTAGTPVSWACQPGMIRTYQGNGRLSNAYKLYSWDNLVEGGTAFDPNATIELPDGNWDTLSAQYTDLNAPINGIYPIADPTIANTGPAAAMTQNGTVNWDFPAAYSIATDSPAYHASTTNKLPMPVKWLYILQDGTWVAPKAGDTADAVTITGADAANPIVGRMAFWTDDETSKVNVNTASEGTFWDTPKAATQDELQFASNPPTGGEFQRFAGHPATTSLSAVFPEMRLGTFNRWSNTGTASSPNSSYLAQLKDIYAMMPRIDWSLGGSQGGTFPINSYQALYSPQVGLFPYSKPDSYAVTTDTNRLYATPDELWFQPVGASSGASRPANTAFGSSNLSARQMARRQFLFTANSRAPETTLFETPRVSLWPITWPNPTSSFYIAANKAKNASIRSTPPSLNPNSNTLTDLLTAKMTTPQEVLLAFDSTLNNAATTGKPYYFQRQNPDSPTWDYSSHITRNIDVVQYLRRELDLPVPGMGGQSLASKWGTDSADWITLNCFDYSRSLINQYTYDPYPTSATLAAPNYGLLYSYTGFQDGRLNGGSSAQSHVEPNSFVVAPIRTALKPGGAIYSTEGAYPALKEVSVVFYAKHRQEPKPPGATGNPPLLYGAVKDPDNWTNLISWDPAAKTGSSQTDTMQAVMMFSFSQMNPGVVNSKGPGFTPCMWIKVTPVSAGDALKVNGISINLPNTPNNSVQWNALQPSTQVLLPAVAGLVNNYTGAPKTFNNAARGSETNWCLVSDDIAVQPTDSLFSLTGGKLQIDIYAPDPSGNLKTDPTGNPACLVSSQQVDFAQWNNGPQPADSSWTGKFPIPLAPRWNVRQAKMVPSLPTANIKNTDQITNGVPMPEPTILSTKYPNWQAEIVPAVIPVNSLNNFSDDPRMASGGISPAGQDVSNSSTDALVYTYKNSTGAATYTSTDFSHRLAAVLLGNTRSTMAEQTTSPFTPYAATGNAPSPAGTALLYGSNSDSVTTQAYELITPYDTVISMAGDPRTPAGGDPRLQGRGVYSAAGSTAFTRIDTAVGSGIKPVAIFPLVRSTLQMQFHALGSPGALPQITGYHPEFRFGTSSTAPIMASRGGQTQSDWYPNTAATRNGSNGLLLGRNHADSEVGLETNVTMQIDPAWDWTALPGNFMDGGVLARPDQNYTSVFPGAAGGTAQPYNLPYFMESALVSYDSGSLLTAKFFSPNRQVPSPVILGTIPSSLTTGWQTLAFCPNPAKVNHPGLGKPALPSATGTAYTTLPDHLLLDLFWMPVAEPYPVSEQFSTAGKVNLNYAMMPFPYIQRKTGMDAVMKSVWLTALPSNVSDFPANYKSYGMLYQKGLHTTHTRYPVNVDATLKAFDYKFGKGDIFRSASQVCDTFLYPNSPDTPNSLVAGADDAPSTANITAWWQTKALTADNAREDPYSAIYSRVTTKSNTFTVHWKVQSLQKRTGSDPKVWTEKRDVMVSELRGSTLIERYIDPNATTIPDYATDTNRAALPMSNYYKWRVASENYFHP